MNVIIVGNGGREHALAWAIAKSPQVDTVFCTPGNAGTAQVAENVDISADQHDEIVALAKEKNAALVVVGPEAPLCDGLVNKLEAAGITAFGPTAEAARIEGDKAFAKELMRTAKVPTAEARVFKDFESAKTYVATRDTGVVVKAAGLAAGKGVIVCPDPADAIHALHRIMVDREFGAAGDVVLVEELLKGQELSVLALVDGQTIYVLETAQDHKAVGEGDIGPNTGGMGAFSPAPIATPQILDAVERDILVPIVDALRQAGAPYKGVLYAGLMITAAGPKVLEFNCRFGDPETQAVLMRFRGDLFATLLAVSQGQLEDAVFSWRPENSVCVVMASEGYPGSYEKGKAIQGIDTAHNDTDTCVFHAGTTIFANQLVTSGGRVLAVTSLGENLEQAQERAYSAIDKITFDGAFCRRDIGAKAVPAK